MFSYGELCSRLTLVLLHNALVVHGRPHQVSHLPPGVYAQLLGGTHVNAGEVLKQVTWDQRVSTAHMKQKVHQ